MSAIFRCALAALTVSFGFAQTTGRQPKFEVASVKLGLPDAAATSMDGGPMPQGPFNQEFMHQGVRDPGRITWTNVALQRILQIAYDVPADRISGPDWLKDARYTIVATLPKDTTIDDFRLMVQDLLRERLRLAAHRGTK